MSSNGSPCQPYRARVSGTRHAVASGHYLAAQAGFQVLEAGGNAIDAGVAGGIALGVVESLMVGFAGVAPILIYLAERDQVVTISGVGVWPEAASCAYFREHHGGLIEGIYSTVVPGAPDAWITALEEFGTMSLGEVAQAAIRLARDGFPMYRLMAELIRGNEDFFRSQPASAAIYLPDGKMPEVGEVFVQADLSSTLQHLADEEAAHRRKGRKAGLAAARDAFYKGDVAARIVAHHKENGGLLGAEDMAGFRVGVEPPCHTRFGGDIDVYGVGPWSQGPAMLEALNILDGIDLEGFGHNSRDYVHAVIEAIKLAMADREAYFGDPRFVDVPVEALLSAEHARCRRAMIRAEEAWSEMPPPGEVAGTGWPSAGRAAVGRRGPAAATGSASTVPGALQADTSIVCVVDGEGNAFVATPSDGNGGGAIVPGTGFVPSTRGKGGRTDPSHPAAVAPRHRPRMTNGPALAIDGRGAKMPFGTPGSDNQSQAMLQVFLNVFLFGMHPQAAVEAPRFATHGFPQTLVPNPPHDYQPGSLFLEGRIEGATGDALAAMGHEVTWWPDWGPAAGHTDIATVCAILADRESGVIEAGADPRRPAGAFAW